MPALPPESRFRRALAFAQSHRWIIGVILALTFLVAGANALEPLVLKYIFDNIEANLPASRNRVWRIFDSALQDIRQFISSCPALGCSNLLVSIYNDIH